MNAKLKKIEQKHFDHLGLLSTLVSNAQISGEKSIINYITTHIYDSFIKDLKDETVTKSEFEKLFMYNNVNKVEMDMLKDRLEDMATKITAVKQESMRMRDMIMERLETTQFLGTLSQLTHW